jgi:hypothetical protein
MAGGTPPGEQCDTLAPRRSNTACREFTIAPSDEDLVEWYILALSLLTP